VRGEEGEWREGGRIIQNYKYLTPGNVQ
jgi:hypothetical protein